MTPQEIDDLAELFGKAAESMRKIAPAVRATLVEVNAEEHERQHAQRADRLLQYADFCDELRLTLRCIAPDHST